MTGKERLALADFLGSLKVLAITGEKEFYVVGVMPREALDGLRVMAGMPKASTVPRKAGDILNAILEPLVSRFVTPAPSPSAFLAFFPDANVVGIDNAEKST